MIFTRNVLVSPLLLLCASSAFAVDTVDLSVIGTIMPGSCTPTFAGGGVVDYGNILTASLSETAGTLLPEKTISYSVTCDAPIAVGVSFSDNRGSSVGDVGWPASASFGLGMNGTAPIGAYAIHQDVTAATGDGATVDLISRQDGALNWILSSSGSVNWANNRVFSFAPTGTLVPGAYSVVAGILKVQAGIMPTNTLDLSAPITLDGLATMTVKYL